MADRADGNGAAAPAGRAVLRGLAIGGCAAVLAVRLWLARGATPWYDEAWTLMIVAQPRWAGFWREVWLDPNAPLYYLLLRIWTAVAGTGDRALILPSLLCAVATAVVPQVWRIAGLSRAARATWGALLFCWMPGILFSVEARCYALLLLLATIVTIAFAAVLARPTRRRAAMWCVAGAAAMLTHYHALFLLAAQGAVYLVRHGRAAVRTWPAALAFAPVAAWGLYHLPRLLHWSAPGVVWYGRVTAGTAWHYAAFTVGPMTPAFPAMVLAIVAVALWIARGGAGEARAPVSPLVAVAAAGGIAVLLAVAVGAARPMLSPRYLTPAVPSILLALVVIVGRVRQPRIGFALLLAPFLATALKAQGLAAFAAEQSRFGWEDASAFIARAHPDRLVFMADVPGTAGAEPGSLAQLGAVFLTRAGQHPVAISVAPAGGGDPNARLVVAARGAARPAILWVYDRRLGMAARFPPAIAVRHPGWRCRRRVSRTHGIVACVRRVAG